MKLLIMDGIPSDHPYSPYSKEIQQLVLENTKHQVDYFRLADMDIHYCTGCWSCWYKTPGYCAIKDDHEQLLSCIPQADQLLYISPVIMGYESALLKTCKDRSIPVIHPYISIVKGEQHHRQRYEGMSPGINVLVLEDEATTPEDIKLIKHTYDRVALNFHSSVNIFHSYSGQGGFDYVLNNI